MLDTWWEVAIAVSGWGAYLAKELIPRLLDRRLARTGRIGVVEGQTRVMCDTTSADGNTYVIDYHPSMATLPQFSDCRRFRIVFDTALSNDTDTQVVFTQFDLEFWGVEGLRLQSHGDEVLIPNEGSDTWQKMRAITVPPHSVVGMRFEVLVGSGFKDSEEAIRTIYGEAVVLLKVQSIDGKQSAFRLCTHSFAGANSVVWPDDKKYPVFNMRSLNRDGWKAGRRPQPRSGVAAVT